MPDGAEGIASDNIERATSMGWEGGGAIDLSVTAVYR
jgi:hypothetical protein